MADLESSALESQFVGELTKCQLPLLAYVRSLLPGDSAANDVAQQANAKIWEKRTEFELGTNFKAWAFSVARYEVLNYRKRQARDARLVFSDELEQTISTELAAAADGLEQRHEALRACLKRLRQRDRDLLLGRYTNTGPLAEYANAMGRSVAALKVTLHRLRNSLLECIQRALNSGEAIV